jgi:hypothetical protein
MHRLERRPLIKPFGIVVIVAYCAVLVAGAAYLLLPFIPSILPHEAALAVAAAAVALGLLMMPEFLTKHFSGLTDLVQGVGVLLFLGASGVLLGQILVAFFPRIATVSAADALLILSAMLVAAIFYKFNKREP